MTEPQTRLYFFSNCEDMSPEEIRKLPSIRVSVDEFLEFNAKLLSKAWKTKSLLVSTCGTKHRYIKNLLDSLNSVGFLDKDEYFHIYFLTYEDAVLTKLKI